MLILQSYKTAVIVNPASANGTTRKRWDSLAAAFKDEELDFVFAFTERQNHATELTRNFLNQGYNLIISVGGDGTANEVVNGFFANGEATHKDAAVSFISTGTGRDLSRTIGMPADFNDAVRHIIKAPLRPVDVGKVSFTNYRGEKESRCFINIADLGLGGDTVARVNRTSKALGGFVSFLWGTVVSLCLYKNQKMTIIVDGETICDEPITVVVAGNGRFFGGGMCVAPNAVIDDGYFDIIILRDLSKLDLLMNLPKVYGGKHLGHPRISSMRGKRIEIISGENALLDIDGEQPGYAPVDIELLPGAINLKG